MILFKRFDPPRRRAAALTVLFSMLSGFYLPIHQSRHEKSTISLGSGYEAGWTYPNDFHVSPEYRRRTGQQGP